MLKRSFLFLLSYMLLFGIVQVAAPAPDSDIVKRSMMKNGYMLSLRVFIVPIQAHSSLFHHQPVLPSGKLNRR
jgi:hypothetical protein